MATRYKVTKEQLERIVESFVMEEASKSKAPVKNMIPSQGAEAKKHVKNKMSGSMVDHSEGMPSVSQAKKKNSQAPEAKKHVSNSTMKHSNKAKVVKESELFNESVSWTEVVDPLCDALGILSGNATVEGQSISKCFVAIAGVLTALGVGKLFQMKSKEDKAAAEAKKKWEAQRAAKSGKGKTSHMEDEKEIKAGNQTVSEDELLNLANKIKQGDKNVIQKAKEAIEKLQSQGKGDQLKKVASNVVSQVG
jgi:hypothetical protein